MAPGAMLVLLVLSAAFETLRHTPSPGRTRFLRAQVPSTLACSVGYTNPVPRLRICYERAKRCHRDNSQYLP